MSINFIIIDDQKTVLDSTCTQVKKFISENTLEARITLCTTQPQDVLDYSRRNFEQLNVYILDINLNSEMNGLTLARMIREKEPNAYIIFLTAYLELSMLVFKYKLKAFDFLVKPVSYEELSECLKALVTDYDRIISRQVTEEKKYIRIKSDYRENLIPVNDIIYIESFGPKLSLHTLDGHIDFYGTLKDMEQSINEMTDTFFRSHKSFLINTKHIKQISLKDQAVIMANGDKCLVSRNKKDYLKMLLGYPLKYRTYAVAG